MKKVCITFVGILIIILLIACFNEEKKPEYLRIHIRANSNSEIDQSIKYQIKDLVVCYFTPKIKDLKSKAQAKAFFENEKQSVNSLIDGFLKENGFNYKSNMVIREEYFPTRVYDDLTLEEGYYDAIIIELGKAEGDNWWCVVYPPLCFSDDNVRYKSIIKEYLDKYLRRSNEKIYNYNFSADPSCGNACGLGFSI